MKSDFSCIIVDDESSAIKLLSSRLQKLFSEAQILSTHTRWDEAVNALRSTHCDILFMDIMMPEKNGMALLRLLPDIDAEIIFVTAYEEHAVRSFQFSPAGYLIKPVVDTELAYSVNKALERIRYKRLATHATPTIHAPKIGIPSYKGIDYVSVADILYLEATGRYVKIIKKDTDILSSYSIGKFKKLMEEYLFLQVHRSYIINPDYIARYESIGNIIMTNGREIPLSKNYKDSFLQLFYKITRVDDLKKGAD